ncbi:MAG: hypothetical protein IKS70_03515 [Bacteroides sp.]|nr:hypothetical protein [Bacteroides sp.]
MKRQQNDNIRQRQQRNMQFTDDRLELLDTIHDMVKTEFDRCKEEQSRNARRGKPPHCRSLWQRILNILSLCLKRQKNR